jgi:phosphoglycerol transferase
MGCARRRMIVLNPFGRPLVLAVEPSGGILRCAIDMALQSTSVMRTRLAPDPRRLIRGDMRRVAPLLLIVVSILLARNLLLESPLMAGDEYAYFAAAQTFPNSAERFAFDPYLPRVYNPVFAAYGSLMVQLSNRPELLLKTFNTVAFALTTVLLLGLITKVGGGAPSLTSAAVLLVIPISAYTAYFMPETTYALLFTLLTCSVVGVLPGAVISGALLAGTVVGTMLLVKPHALAMFVAVTLTFGALFVAPSAFRPRRRALLAGVALFVASTYVALVFINGALSGGWQLHPFTFVGGIYQPFLSQGFSRTSWVGRIPQLLSILCGHAIVVGTLLAPAIAVGIATLRRLYAKPGPVADVVAARTTFVVVVFAGFALFVALAMTTNFTAQAAQTSPIEYLRLHGRYYSFVIPLYLVLYFALGANDRDAATADSWIRPAAAAGCVLAGLLFYLQSRRIIYPFDFPEAFVFSTVRGSPREGLAGLAAGLVTPGAIAATMAGYALIVWRGRRALFLYPVLLITLFLLSTAGVTAWQRGNSLGNHRLRADARAVRKILPPAERDRGLVVGSEWNGALAYTLFNLWSSARVLVREPGATLTDSDIPPDTRWVLLVGPYTLPPVNATVRLRTPRVSLLLLPPTAPPVSSSVSR